MSTLDAFLQEALAEGTPDSRGVFTINVEKAQVKLASFQLARLDQFPMFLLAAGTAAGTTKFEVSFPAKNRTRVRYENWKISSADFRYVGMESLKEGTPRELRFLGIAISTIGSRYNFTITSGELMVKFEQSVMQFPKSTDESGLDDCLVIDIEANLEEEFRLGLQGQQKFCAFPVIIGERKLNGGYDPSTESVDSFAFLHRPGSGLHAVSLNYPGNILVEPTPEEGVAPMVLSFTHPGDAGVIGFWLLVNGLACRAPGDFAPPGFYGVAAADTLELSLSYEVVRNESYKHFQQQVMESCQLLCTQAQYELQHSNDRIRLRMLEDAVLHLTRKRPQFGLRTQAQSPETSRGSVNQALVPVHHPDALAELLPKVEELDDIRLEMLLDGYKKRLLFYLEKGELNFVLTWRDAYAQVKLAAKKHSALDDFIHALLRIVKDPLKMLKFDFCEGYDQVRVANYLESLQDWANGLAFQDPSEPVHQSWLAPLGAEADPQLPWSVLWRLLAEQKLGEAVNLVKQNPELAYEGNEHPWLQYFWRFHGGRLSLMDNVKIRVALSFATPSFEPNHETLELADARYRIVGGATVKGPFWPYFLTLLERSVREGGEIQYRATWLSLIAATLVRHYLSDNGLAMLSRPFQPRI